MTSISRNYERPWASSLASTQTCVYELHVVWVEAISAISAIVASLIANRENRAVLAMLAVQQPNTPEAIGATS